MIWFSSPFNYQLHKPPGKHPPKVWYLWVRVVLKLLWEYFVIICSLCSCIYRDDEEALDEDTIDMYPSLTHSPTHPTLIHFGGGGGKSSNYFPNTFLYLPHCHHWQTPLTMTSDDEHTMLFILLYKPICLHNKTCDKRVFEPGLGLTWTV